ncbi:MAG TPA: hypothetical protein VGC41_07400 [Kofleriaceae bacterium]
MRIALIVVAACSTREAPAPVPVPVPKLLDAGRPDAAADAALASTILIRPMALAGPYQTIAAACAAARPCGFTDMDKDETPINPATTVDCNLETDPNAISPRSTVGSTPKMLQHATKELSIQIASQTCARPRGIRAEEDVYYVFVKKGDAWWRSDPVWEWAYNDKYGGGSMTVRWNDQPGRTFFGIQAGLDMLACGKQASSTETLEMMLRIEPGEAQPIVFPPIVVGERFKLGALGPDSQLDADCKPQHRETILDEHWAGVDDLELTGAPTWTGIGASEGAIVIGLKQDDVPSPVGRYRFVR